MDISVSCCGVEDADLFDFFGGGGVVRNNQETAPPLSVLHNLTLF